MQSISVVGVVGVGVVGRALYEASINAGIRTIGFDPFIPQFGELNETVLDCEVVFVSVPTLTVDGVQQLGPLNDVCQKLKDLAFQGVVCIRCTTLPGTCAGLKKVYGLRIVHMPEFLTEANAEADFMAQDVLFVSGDRKDRPAVFGAMFSILPRPKDGWRVFQVEDMRVTEFQKYFANCHKAIKVAFCNEIYQACLTTGVDYNDVRKFAIEVDGVGENHTKVPGPDKLLGYGGLCFPKDMAAFAAYLDSINVDAQVFHAAIGSNDLVRAQ